MDPPYTRHRTVANHDETQGPNVSIIVYPPRHHHHQIHHAEQYHHHMEQRQYRTDEQHQNLYNHQNHSIQQYHQNLHIQHNHTQQYQHHHQQHDDDQNQNPQQQKYLIQQNSDYEHHQQHSIQQHSIQQHSIQQYPIQQHPIQQHPIQQHSIQQYHPIQPEALLQQLLATNAFLSHQLSIRGISPDDARHYIQLITPFQNTSSHTPSTEPIVRLIPSSAVANPFTPSNDVLPSLASFDRQANEPQPVFNDSDSSLHSSSHEAPTSNTESLSLPSEHASKAKTHKQPAPSIKKRSRSLRNKNRSYNAFFVFMMNKKDEARKADPFLDYKDLTKRLAADWASLPESEKAAYKERARELSAQKISAGSGDNLD